MNPGFATGSSITRKRFHVQQLTASEAAVLLPQVTQLLSDSFFEQRDEGAVTELLAYNAYVSELYVRLLWRILKPGRKHVMLVATPHIVPDNGSKQVVCGVVEVTQQSADEALAKAVGCAAGAQYVLVDDMVVSPKHRRQGLGRALLGHCQHVAASLLTARAGSPVLMLLYVQKDNAAAVRLYESAGFSVEEDWIDPDWEASAYAGKAGPPRKLLMAKRCP
ncbi:hypothetical protein WJX72_006495 [[Myrmecia] bisecta]|uniref:N-acetyltransferase domain-containing protein n=1 Tax=[Myrmecia] bisecta TaxID=41462 RepID=A0AAW1Q2B8_9CHLO